MKKQIAGVVFSLLISAEVFYGAQADQGDDLCKLGIQAYEQEKYEEAINYLAQASEMGFQTYALCKPIFLDLSILSKHFFLYPYCTFTPIHISFVPSGVSIGVKWRM